MKKIAAYIDYFFNKLLPKKFIVWVVCTIFVFKGLNVPEEYYYVAMVYLGVNSLAKFAQAIKGK